MVKVKGFAHIDFETRSAVELKAAGAYVYAADPTTSVHCMGWSIEDGPIHLWKAGDSEPKELFNWISSGGQVKAHNCSFEYLIWNNVMALEGWPILPLQQIHCTMAQAYAMALPGSLENAAAAVGITEQKDMAGHRTMMQLSKPRRIDKDKIVWWEREEVPEKFEKLYAYCIQDVNVERMLDQRRLPLSPSEREIWLLDQEINTRGVQVDLSTLTNAIKLVDFEGDYLNQKIREVTGNAVATCTAVGQLTDWIRWQGVATESVNKTDVSALLEQKGLPENVREALSLRQEAAKTSTKKLVSMLAGTSGDGRIKGMFQYHGAGTGRWAGRRTQLHNLPRPKLDQEHIDSIFEILGAIE
jgi:DNA polymerase